MSTQHVDYTSLVQESDPYFCPLRMYKDCSAATNAAYSSMITPSFSQMRYFSAANMGNTPAGNLTM
jgi:hypothetical protein